MEGTLKRLLKGCLIKNIIISDELMDEKKPNLNLKASNQDFETWLVLSKIFRYLCYFFIISGVLSYAAARFQGAFWQIYLFPFLFFAAVLSGALSMVLSHLQDNQNSGKKFSFLLFFLVFLVCLLILINVIRTIFSLAIDIF